MYAVKCITHNYVINRTYIIDKINENPHPTSVIKNSIFHRGKVITLKFETNQPKFLTIATLPDKHLHRIYAYKKYVKTTHFYSVIFLTTQSVHVLHNIFACSIPGEQIRLQAPRNTRGGH